ncbi:MAG: hypothetical protein EB060_10400 [Proteobacteria bacterium]|nr:hypothetical protein [Pseudomonadota bacterium]
MQKPILKTDLVFVTPEMARKWLEKNVNNRNIRRHYVAKLRNDLRNNRFMTTHEGIAFNCNGELKDGQHRLTAIAEEGIGAWLMVTSGLPNDAVPVINRGSIRTITDNGNMSGFSMSKQMVAMAYIAMEAPAGIAHSKSTSEYDVIDFIKRNQEAFEAIPHVTKKNIGRAANMAAFLRAYPHCPLTAWNRCLQLFLNGIDDDFHPVKERAIVVFRDYCLTNKANGYSASIDMYRRCQRAIKAFMNAEELKIVKPCEQDLFPLVEGILFK